MKFGEMKPAAFGFAANVLFMAISVVYWLVPRSFWLPGDESLFGWPAILYLLAGFPLPWLLSRICGDGTEAIALACLLIPPCAFFTWWLVFSALRYAWLRFYHRRSALKWREIMPLRRKLNAVLAGSGVGAMVYWAMVHWFVPGLWALAAVAGCLLIASGIAQAFWNNRVKTEL